MKPNHNRAKVSKLCDECNDVTFQIALKTAKLLRSEDQAVSKEAMETYTEYNHFFRGNLKQDKHTTENQRHKKVFRKSQHNFRV